MTSLSITEATKVRRGKDRASYRCDDIYRLIDDLKMGHVGFMQNRAPVNIPMLCWRIDDSVFLHASQGGRFMQQLQLQPRVCISFAELNEWVLAKSAFHHSANYRSAVIFGVAKLVDGEDEQILAYQRLLEQIAPGRWGDVRPPSKKELAATRLMKIQIKEGSYKFRTGGPKDDTADLDLPVWAGVKPVG